MSGTNFDTICAMSKVVDRAASVFLRSILMRMKELGLNQTTLAARMKASRPYVSKVLNGDVSVTLRTASRFAKALQMDFIPVLMPEAEPVSTTVIPKTVVGRMKTI